MKLAAVFVVFATAIASVQGSCSVSNCGSIATRGECVDWCESQGHTKRGLLLRKPHPRALEFMPREETLEITA
ncbi:hypothetical protein F5X99DRAFT_407720 [Biscogniauxia marginata]|nr:hypothetical protein F5X99DRAFT_407720 [Biscogniauxia marginata]